MPVTTYPTSTAPVAGTAVDQDEWWKSSMDVSIPGVPDTGLIGTAAGYTPTAGVAGGTYTATDSAGSGSYTPTAAVTGQDYTTKDWTVDPNQLTSSRVADITKADSPLMQMAATDARQQMGKRGLINSSMAIGAGQNAVISSALPMAQQEAQVAAQAANFNANATNEQRRFGATAAQQAATTNQDATNRAAEFGAANVQQTNISNQNATNRAAEYGATAEQQAATTNQEAVNRGLEHGANATNTLQAQSNTIRQQAAQLSADAGNKLLMQDLDNQFKVAISNTDVSMKMQMQEMADKTKTDLAGIQATYQQMISSNEQAGAMYSKVLQNITDIVNNPDITNVAPDFQKNTAITNQKNMLKTGMEVVSAVSGLALEDILDFDAPAKPA